MSRILLSLTLLLTLAFLTLSHPLYRISSTQPHIAREFIENYLETLRDVDDDVEVLSHDDEYVYLASYGKSVPADDADSDAAPRHSHRSSLSRLTQYLHGAALPVKVHPLPQFLGHLGRVSSPAILPPHQQALGGKIPDGYTKPAEMRAFFEKLAAKHPEFIQWVDLGQRFAKGMKSIEGRPVHALRLNVQKDAAETKPAVLFASAHHSRELITPEIAIAIADVFAEGYEAQNPHIMKWLNEYDIWIVPVVNVDGHEFVWSNDNMWRKNRRLTREARNGVTAAYGVDLNRNYDLGWDSQGGSQEFETETYRGSAPFSEPETQIMKAFSEVMHFTKVMDFHSSGQQVLVHYTRTAMPDMMRKFIEEEGKKLASSVQYGVRPPSDDAEHQEWQIKVNTEYSFLVETGTSFQPPFSEALQEVRRVWPAVVTFLERPVTVRGQVTDANTGAPIPSAQIAVKQVEWKAGETRNSHPTVGTYHLFLPAGTFDVEISADGYKTATRQIVVEGDNHSQIVDIALEAN